MDLPDRIGLFPFPQENKERHLYPAGIMAHPYLTRAGCERRTCGWASYPLTTAFLLILKGTEDSGKIVLEVTKKLLILVCKS